MPALIALIGSAVTAIGTFFSGLGGTLLGLITLEGVKFTAQKVFWLFMVGFVVPVLLYNVAVSLMTSVMELGYTLIGGYTGTGSSLTISLTGMAGWIAQQIYLPQAVSTYLSAVSVRFVISMIPFLR